MYMPGRRGFVPLKDSVEQGLQEGLNESGIISFNVLYYILIASLY